MLALSSPPLLFGPPNKGGGAGVLNSIFRGATVLKFSTVAPPAWRRFRALPTRGRGLVYLTVSTKGATVLNIVLYSKTLYAELFSTVAPQAQKILPPNKGGGAGVLNSIDSRRGYCTKFQYSSPP